uniref:Uncharacterized protein n=1 Tax=Magallana gigas TaxID=29159 RepID=K1QTF6_MAGGI
MAKLQRYKQISHDSGENGYSFVNLAYNEDNGNAEDIERRWTFDEDEPKFKPRKKRCTKVNVAVALVILAAGGLGIFLIVKLSRTTKTIPTTTSGTNTTAQPLMTTTSLSEKSTASTTTIISSSTNASTMTTTTTPIPKSTSAVTTILPPTTTTTSNVVSTTQEVTTHTTANGTNNTEGAGMMFDASMTVTSVNWDENYRNSTSGAYLDLVSNFTSQVEEGIKNSEVGSSFSHVTVTSVSPGSVVFDFRIYMTSSSYPSGGSKATVTISVVRGVLVQVVQNAKANGTQTLLLGIDEAKIVVNTVSPCTNSTYLTTTLLSYCIDLNRLNQMVNASEDVKCKYILSAVDCVLEKIRVDFGVNCTDEHKIAALKEFSGTVQISLGIDPKICDLPITMTTTKPTMTTAVSTTTSPCTNSSYLTTTLLSVCINSSRLNEVTSSSDDVKCNFILSALDCVLDKIRMDFGVNCTDEHKIAALGEFSGTVQSYLGIDPKICNLPITMTTTKPTMTTAVSTTTSPCTNSTYLTSTLLSNCINSSQLGEVANSSDDVKCNYISSIVACVLEGVRSDIGITCSDKQKIVALYEIEELGISYLSIDPKTCDLSANISTTQTTTPAGTTFFILSAVDCVLEKIRLDFGITCTAEHRVAALDEFSGIVQTYLEVDPKTC